jgi:hypothetical protein
VNFARIPRHINFYTPIWRAFCEASKLVFRMTCLPAFFPTISHRMTKLGLVLTRRLGMLELQELSSSLLTALPPQFISLRSCTIPLSNRNKRDHLWQRPDLRLWPEARPSYIYPTPPSFRKDPPVCRPPPYQSRYKE